MKYGMTTALLLAIFIVGCEREGAKVGSHGHDHGNGAAHAHGDDPDHQGGASEGVIARLTEGGKDVGYLRLKLHDDKGDIEAWVARDASFSEPFELPLDTTITVTFTDKNNRSAQLGVRNREQNEDEDGKANIRDGKTNYFIFPGASGEDASWLQGADFLSTTRVSFSTEGKGYTTPLFVLRPHTHGDGHAH